MIPDRSSRAECSAHFFAYDILWFAASHPLGARGGKCKCAGDDGMSECVDAGARDQNALVPARTVKMIKNRIGLDATQSGLSVTAVALTSLLCALALYGPFLN